MMFDRSKPSGGLTLEVAKDDKELIEFWQDWQSWSRIDFQGGYLNCVTFKGPYVFVASVDHKDAPKGEVYTIKEAAKEAAFYISDFFDDLDDDIYDYLLSKSGRS